MQPQGSLISILIWSYRVLYSLSQITFHAGNGMAKIPLDTLLRQLAKLHFFLIFFVEICSTLICKPCIDLKSLPRGKKWEKIFWVTKRDNKRITNWGKRDYNLGQLQRFQIGAKRLQIRAGISNHDKEISNWIQPFIQAIIHSILLMQNKILPCLVKRLCPKVLISRPANLPRHYTFQITPRFFITSIILVSV